MIKIYQHKTIKTFFYFRAEGILDPHDVNQLDEYFSTLTHIEENSITTFVEVCKDTQLINYEFITRMKPLVPKYKRYIKRRIVFGLSGIISILFKNYTSLIGLKNAYIILNDKEECEKQFSINFKDDFEIVLSNNS